MAPRRSASVRRHGRGAGLLALAAATFAAARAQEDPEARRQAGAREAGPGAGQDAAPPAAVTAEPPLAAWHDHAALQAALETQVGGRRDLARLTTYGRSRAGRELFCVELGMIDHPQRARLPALLVVAGLDGNHRVGTEIVLDHLRRLLEGYGKEEAVTRLLDEHVVYLLPRANPDGAEAAFAAVPLELRGNLRPVDDDRDGRVDEDPPSDVDGDGFVTQMRWRDAEGTWIADPDEPRAMRPADPLKGERGVYRLGVEGIDRDGDDACGEDGPGDVVPARNFPLRWQEFDPAAGRFAMEEPEALALGRFLFERPSIALALVYGAHDNLAVDAKAESGGGEPAAAPAGGRGFRGSRTLPSGIVRDDVGLYGEVAARYRKTAGVTSKALLEADDGAFVPFAYFQFGVPAFAAHVWSPPLDVQPPGAAKEGSAAKEAGAAKEVDAAKETGAPEEAATGEGRREGRGRGGGRGGDAAGGGGASDERKLLAWNDHAMGGTAFVPWHEVSHPKYGTVEVGGWKPYVRSNPPLAEVPALARKHSDFLLELGALFAELRLADAQVEALGNDLWRVKASVVNEGWLPSLCSMAERNRQPRPTRLELDAGAARLLEGRERTVLGRIAGSGGREEAQWLLLAPAGTKVTLRLWSEKAGDDERVVELR